MKRPYVAPDVSAFGSINQVTGFLVSTARMDVAWGPTGDIISNGDDHGSQNFCQQPDGTLVPCEAPPGV